MTRTRKVLLLALSILAVFAMMVPAQALTKRINLGTFGCAAGGFVHLEFKHNGPAGSTVTTIDPNIWVHTTNPYAGTPNAIIWQPVQTQFFVGTTIIMPLGVKKVLAYTGSWVDFYTGAGVVPNVTFVRWFCA